jgi:signal transduction histidine kinase
MFVRYIAHEVRTPLNTAIMGLQALAEDLQPVSQENLDTVMEVKDSCNIAVEVLNELLLFDKLENGNLLLEKTTVNALSFIKHTIKPFHMQVIVLYSAYLI